MRKILQHRQEVSAKLRFLMDHWNLFPVNAQIPLFCSKIYSETEKKLKEILFAHDHRCVYVQTYVSDSTYVHVCRGTQQYIVFVRGYGTSIIRRALKLPWFRNCLGLGLCYCLSFGLFVIVSLYIQGKAFHT